MSKREVKGISACLLASVIWGMAFVAQTMGMDYVGPWTFNAVRTLIGWLTLCIYIAIRDSKRKKENEIRNDEVMLHLREQEKKHLRNAGFLCGLALTAATMFQQYGLNLGASPGKAGFLTALYIVLVPIVGLFFGKKVGIKVAFGVVFALLGLYLLCMKPGEMGITLPDLLVLGCAIVFTGHILLVDFYSPMVDGVKLSRNQFLVAGVLSSIGMFLWEDPKIGDILAAAAPILYTGVLSSGVGYTLQIIGQQNLNPTIASLLMSLESVVAVLAGWIFMGDILSVRELIGCVVMFVAIIMAQLPEKKQVKALGENN